VINPGGATEETNTVTGFGSLLLAEPLRFDHAVGELVVVVDTPDPTATSTAPAGCVSGQKLGTILIVLLRFGSREGQRRYHAAFDLNGDRRIGVRDLELALTLPVCRRR
jgi:hypothetical protein